MEIINAAASIWNAGRLCLQGVFRSLKRGDQHSKWEISFKVRKYCVWLIHDQFVQMGLADNFYAYLNIVLEVTYNIYLQYTCSNSLFLRYFRNALIDPWWNCWSHDRYCEEDIVLLIPVEFNVVEKIRS